MAGKCHGDCNPETYDCGSPVVQFPDNFVGKMVFVAYGDPNTPDDLPSWADSFAQNFANYLHWVSNSHLNPNISVLRRIDNSTKAWKNPVLSVTYQNPCGQGLTYGNANAWLFQKIHDDYSSLAGNPNVWNGVNVVFIVHYNSVFCGASRIAVGNLGFTGTGFDPSTVGFNGIGVSMTTSQSWTLNDSHQVLHLEGAVSHEFGHRLGFLHDLGTSSAGLQCGMPTPPSEFINMGIYSVMDEWALNNDDVGFLSYHPMNLLSKGWVAKQVVSPTCTPLTIELPDIRSANGKVLEVDVEGSDQYFLVVNHPGEDQGIGYDYKYGTSGALIWHVWRLPGELLFRWDLESAAGKLHNPSRGPDPNAWWDPLEEDVCYHGSGADLFHPDLEQHPVLLFGPSTNPSSNLYVNTYQDQPVRSNVLIQVQQGTGSNLSITVKLDLTPNIISPVATTIHTTTESPYSFPSAINASWSICGNPVDIQLSDATGTNFANIATGVISNSGSGTYPYSIPSNTPPGQSYKLRVMPSGAPQSYIESGPFTIWALSNQTMRLVDKTATTKTFQLTWNTSITSQGQDRADLVKPSGAPLIVSSGVVSSQDHVLEFQTSECQQGNWQFRVSSQRTTSTVSSLAGSLSVCDCTSGPVITNVQARTDSVPGTGQYFSYQCKAKISWTTNVQATSQVEYRPSGTTKWLVSDEIPTLSTAHYMTISNLLPGTIYELKPISRVNGCPGFGSTQTVETDAAPVTISFPPNWFQQSVQFDENEHPYTEITVSFNTNVPASCKINLRKDQYSAIAFGPAEYEEGALHSSYSQSISQVYNTANPPVPGLISCSMFYDMVITVWPNANFSGEDTQFPDGYSGNQATTVYCKFKTPRPDGLGGTEPEFTMVGEEQQLDANPILKTALISNNPNPFASTTSIRFSLKESGKVRLDVFDLQGRLVKILKSEELGSGPHEVQWDRRDKAGERVNPGIYFYRLIVGEFIDTKKMVVLR